MRLGRATRCPALAAIRASWFRDPQPLPKPLLKPRWERLELQQADVRNFQLA
jgi:hypothetical protein